MRRCDLFGDDCDRAHFVELLGELVGRYGVILHAYVLMENHLTGEAGARTNARAWRRLLPFAAIAEAVEGVRGARERSRPARMQGLNRRGWTRVRPEAKTQQTDRYPARSVRPRSTAHARNGNPALNHLPALSRVKITNRSP